MSYNEAFQFLLPYIIKIVGIVPNEILQKANANKKNTKKIAIKSIFDFPEWIAPLPKVFDFFVDPSFYYINDFELRSIYDSKTNQTDTKSIQCLKKKSLSPLKNVKENSIRKRFKEKQKTYLDNVGQTLISKTKNREDVKIYKEATFFIDKTFESPKK